jgi:hypothetical protein
VANVHIICRDWQSDRIIPRLANLLHQGTGWGIGPKIDPKASANLAFPYLEAPQVIPSGTRLVAEFSHYETTVPAKAREWERISKLSDLRLTWASQYRDLLLNDGPAALVTPPLDRDAFDLAIQPSITPDGTALRLGVSGWVYKGGRKGERLVKVLSNEGIEMVATGAGWPCRMLDYSWGRMHEFYWSLDGYVCTSLIEGIPYPPLEALACGIPVIVPIGVGLLDDLPDMPGIERYQAGDGPSLLSAAHRLSRTLRSGQIDRLALRATTERFTLAAWIGDHEQAIARLLAPTPAPDPVPTITVPQITRKKRPVSAPESVVKGAHGVYLVAYGSPALACLERAISSIRTHMPGLEICVTSAVKPQAEIEHWVERPDTDVGARGAKTEMYDLAPATWESVLYLDADTELVQPITSLFAILADGWDVIVCPNPSKYATARDMRRPDNGDECDYTFGLIGTDEILQYNGGVLGFRRSDVTAAFCRAWHDEWSRYGKRDQAALDRVLYASPLRIWTLSSEFNRVDRYDQPTPRTAIVHHPTKARRHTGVIKGRLDSDEAWMRVGVEQRRPA